MEDFKGTKGEWKYEFNSLSQFSGNGQFTIKAGEVGVPIGLLPMPYGGKKGGQEANAKLIAAAPELLEAVKYLTDVWDEVQVNWREKPDHVQEKFLKAIKKTL